MCGVGSLCENNEPYAITMEAGMCPHWSVVVVGTTHLLGLVYYRQICVLRIENSHHLHITVEGSLSFSHLSGRDVADLVGGAFHVGCICPSTRCIGVARAAELNLI